MPKSKYIKKPRVQLSTPQGSIRCRKVIENRNVNNNDAPSNSSIMQKDTSKIKPTIDYNPSPMPSLADLEVMFDSELDSEKCLPSTSVVTSQEWRNNPSNNLLNRASNSRNGKVYNGNDLTSRQIHINHNNSTTVECIGSTTESVIDLCNVNDDLSVVGDNRGVKQRACKAKPRIYTSNAESTHITDENMIENSNNSIRTFSPVPSTSRNNEVIQRNETSFCDRFKHDIIVLDDGEDQQDCTEHTSAKPIQVPQPMEICDLNDPANDLRFKIVTEERLNELLCALKSAGNPRNKNNRKNNNKSKNRPTAHIASLLEQLFEKRNCFIELDEELPLIIEDGGIISALPTVTDNIKLKDVYAIVRLKSPELYVGPDLDDDDDNRQPGVDRTYSPDCLVVDGAEPQVQDVLSKKIRLPDCPVCMNRLNIDNGIASTLCGHVFCLKCITSAIKVGKNRRCPTCRKYVKKNGYHRLFM